MDHKKLKEQIQENLTVEKIEKHFRDNMTEVFSVVALAIGAISSSWDFFTGPKLTILVFTLCTIIGIFATESVCKVLDQLYGFFREQNSTTRMIYGAVKIVLGLFIPFVLFGVYGLLAGYSFHVYTNPKSGSLPKMDKEHHGED